MKHNRILAVFGGALGVVLILLVAFGAFYIVPEGHVAIAEAEAIQLVNEQLSKPPRYIDLVRAKAWNGSLPQTMLGSDSQTLFQIN